MTNSNPPPISIQLAIDPPQFTRGSLSEPILSVTATSHATEPITIFTWGTLFNVSRARRSGNYTCLDLTTNTPVQLQTIKCHKRVRILQVLDGPDDKFFWTLEPEKPVIFTGDLNFGTRPAHQYRLGVRDGESIRWWWYGKKEKVLAPPGTEEELADPSGLPIELMPVTPLDFEMMEPSTS